MTWLPITEGELFKNLADAYKHMTMPQQQIWKLINLPPTKWIHHPWGDEGAGFWVVAIIGNQCLYYNDIEDGYNWSSYTQFGIINEYNCDDDDLIQAINRIVDIFQGQEQDILLEQPQPIETNNKE